MKAFILLCSIFSVFFSIHAQFDGLNTMIGPNTTITTSIDSSLWLDSTCLRFVKITVNEPIEKNQSNEIHSIDMYYSNTSYFSVRKGECQLFPLTLKSSVTYDSISTYNIKHLEGLYLIDDFDTDSLDVLITLHSGYAMQSQMYTYTIEFKVPFNLDSNSELTQEEATNKWYRRWLKDHPEAYVTRENYGQYYQSCED